MDTKMRLNKFLAHKGYASRRSADTLIAAGKVFVNGVQASLGDQVSDSDTVEIKDFSTENFEYILYYKPKGLLTQASAPGESDIATQIKRDHKITGLFPIGRLDKDAEGLIILTNDGRITAPLIDQKSGITQQYEVEVDTRVTQTFLNRMTKGVRIDGHMTAPAEAVHHASNERMFVITLAAGRKYHIRRMCATLGYHVVSQKRTRIGNFELRNLKSGGFHRLTKKEGSALRTQFGLK
jgi:pseudouridine synthase